MDIEEKDFLVESFNYYNDNLCNRRFKIVFGNESKGKFDLVVRFKDCHYKHLFGLQKLTDLPKCRKNGSSVYQDILNKKLTYGDLKKSVYFNESYVRMANYTELLYTLKNGKVLIQSEDGHFLGIQADYLMYTFKCGFLSHLFFKNINYIYEPVTFFLRDNNDYVRGLERFTIISIEEV